MKKKTPSVIYFHRCCCWIYGKGHVQNYVMICNNMILYKKILRVRQLLLKGKIIGRDMENGPELLKYVLAI